MSGSLSSYETPSNVVPLINNVLLQTMTDDECVERLATAIEGHDETRLIELAALISRLAVPIEL
ncbi:MAG: hypothetical protein K2W78_09865 [Xanthobacteraceae bacterium]|nr:hypothetical protein [Xanthobacteraceae bacterium]